MASTGTPVISTRGLTKRYGDVDALGPVDMEIRGLATGLLGPNGAGKTTLIKTLLGLVSTTQGTGTVLGMDIAKQRLDIRQAIGYMPELDAQIGGFNGIGYVAYAGELAGLPRSDAMQRAHEVLNYVGIGEERYRPAHTYSTGMRQKAKLAQAIVHDPKLLFLDEPTNGLDPRGRDEMLELIRDIALRHQIPVLLSSHLLPDVERVCSDVVVLNEGRVIAQGDIARLQEAASTTWLVRVKGRPELLGQRLAALKIAFRHEEGFTHVDLPEGRSPNLIMDAAAAAGVQVRHLRPRRTTLEDLFVQVMTREA